MEQVKVIPATVALIAVNVVVYVLEYYGPGALGYAIYSQALSTSALRTGDWYTLLTSMFMHGGIYHILCNMMSLYWMGMILERLYGPVRFLVLYFISGIVGGLAFVFINAMAGNAASCVGASGAVFGLFAAYGWILVREQAHPVLFGGAIRRSDLTGYFTLIVINVLMAFTPGIAWQGHLGGFVAGAVVGAILYETACRRVAGGGRR